MWLSLCGIALILAIIANSVQCFVNAPKIISRDGNLIFESGANRNISFRLSGTSRFLINEEYDVLDLLLATPGVKKRSNLNGNKEDFDAGEDYVDVRALSNQLEQFQSRVFGPNGLNQMFQQLQNRSRSSKSMLRRFQVRLRTVETKVRQLQSQLELDNCRSGPCQNGGSCYNTFNGYRCQCRSAFEGSRCEKDVNECALYEGTDLGCQNGAQCINQVGSYNCLCAAGWHGIHCTQRKGDCSLSSAWELCGHGSCVPSNDEQGYRCLCEAGWKSNGLSPACNEDVDECSDTAAHTPCSTKCINLPGSFTCGPCPPGLTGNGISCLDMDECAENNGGCSLNPKVDCINTYGSHHCGVCPVGWIGDGRTCVRDSRPGSTTGSITSCSQNPNICDPRAICREVSNTIVCSCPQGMVGLGFGPNGCTPGTAKNCQDLPCLNGGICLDAGVSNFTCMCPRGYRQPICEPLPNPCTTNPCRNGGRCTPTQANTDGFVCQCMSGYRDRLCSSRFSSCNAMLSSASGSLKYPPSGSSYEHNAQCAWVIRTNESKVLNVTFNSFNLEDSTECRYDWLQINDGRSAGAQIIGRYCGHHLPHGGNIISSGNQLYLWFRSDNGTSHEGFDLSWQSIEPQCGGRLEFDTHGTLASPGSPGNYPKNRNCQWHLVASSTKRIKLTFFSLQLENHENCNFDYVEILDGISKRELAKFCSSAQPAPAPLLLATHEAFINFHSDADGTDLGFQLHYSAEERIPGCGGIYTSKEGTIHSPISEADTISCEYEIRMAVGELITIEFTQFEMALDNCLELYDVLDDSTKLFQAKHCGESEQQLPPSFFSLYNRVLIKYYVTSQGLRNFELNYRMSCSRTFDSPDGIIQSPGYPNLTNTESMCTFKIITSPNTVIGLNIIDFQMGNGMPTNDEDDDCGNTFIRINDGMNQNILGPFCEKNSPGQEIITQTNMAIILLKTDTSSRGRGFKFSYRSLNNGSNHCGGIHTKEGQNIRLPVNERNRYENNLNCLWLIVAPPKKGIQLHWEYVKLERTSDCSADYVAVYDGINTEDANKRLIRLCSLDQPNDFVTHSRHLTIKFKSDYGETDEGFEISYRFIDVKTCGGHIYGTEGILLSPGYPLNYTSDLDCRWHLSSPVMTQMEIQLEMLDLEVTSDCSRDFLEFRNGGMDQSPLIGVFCGPNFMRRIPSLSNEFYIRFHSDASVSGRGFRLHWRVFASGCGGRVLGNNGVITSPSYPQPYMHNAECEWHFQVHQGSGIDFLVEDMEMENLYDCNYDNVNFYNSDRTSPLKSLCEMPDVNNSHIIIDTNEAAIVFRSDSSNSERGFRISFKAICERVITAISGTIESLNYGEPLLNEDLINCNWTIRAPRGNHIRLEFSYFERLPESLPTELSGGLYLIDNGTVIPILEPGVSYNSTSNLLTILHNASNINFQLEYRIDGCIQEFRESSGNFVSPNYPGMYPNNIECYWLIHAQMGEKIKLTVQNMDIEDSINCTKDALAVSNYPFDTNAHERHCGVSTELIITSAGHRMHVRFISDGSHNGKGFSVTYQTVKETCGGKIAARNGVIQSPNYPLNYPPGSQCEWLVVVSPHHQIIFDIQDLALEMGFDCSWDYLEAFDMSPGDGADDAEGQRIFKLCESKYVFKNRSNSNTALIRFVSDESVSSKGFRLHFHESCGETVDVDETDFEYLIMNRHVIGNETCTWVLRASDPGKHIIFTPTDITLHTEADQIYSRESDCMEHGVKIYDGIEAKGTPRMRFCRSHPPAIISNGRALTITLPTSLIAAFEGHYMTMDTSCGSVYTALSGRFTSPYYPASYPPDIECVWTIFATGGNSISLTLESMDLEASDGCNNDYLEVREHDERGPLIGVYCGNQLPNVIKSKQSIWLKFSSNDDVVGEGFMASYNYELHNEINGTEGDIGSPNYPNKFNSNQPYSWRVIVDKDYVILITVQHMRDVDQSYISFYDGYSDIGSRLEYRPGQPLISSTNVVYLTSTRGPFLLDWQRLSKESLRSNRTAEKQIRLCGHQLINLNKTVISFNSPGYPNGYPSSLQCSWTFMTTDKAMHAVLNLGTVDLEQFGDTDECPVDYLVISASADMQNWEQLAKICKRPNNTNRVYHGQPYLRLEFITDSSVNRTGFSSVVKTACGSEMTDSRGLVNITQLVSASTIMTQECVWTLRVRQGRRIRISFPDSQLEESDGNGLSTDTTSGSLLCRNYFMIRNGYADDSPFLGHGKYCNNGITDVLETTSNRAYIKFHRIGYPRFRASFRYEELSPACSGHIILDLNSQAQVINSPNYPNLPNPHSECVWWISAPVHHRITLEFIGKFDLTAAENSDNCLREYVQVNDGSTELTTLWGRFCGATKPDTLYSSGRELRIKFYTDVPEPHQGFQARVQLAICGGSYYSPEGIINSPKIEDLRRAIELKPLDECVYTIEVAKGNTIKLSLENMAFPNSVNCTYTTHLQLEEIEAFGDEGTQERESDRRHVCGTESRLFTVETNKIIIRLRVPKHELIPNTFGFRMTYSSIGSQCGETIRAQYGVLQTPGYPQGVSQPTHCVWRLEVAKGNRIKVEILDFDTGSGRNGVATDSFRGRLIFANDHKMQSILARISRDPPAEIVSADNTMGIDAFLLSFSRHRGIKLRFRAYGRSECGGPINLESGGTLYFERSNSSGLVHCTYNINPPTNATTLLQLNQYNISNPLMRNSYICLSLSPLKILRQQPPEVVLYRALCNRNVILPLTMRIPFPVQLIISGNSRNGLRQLSLDYSLQKCGGIVPLEPGDNLTIQEPQIKSDGPVNCAWAIGPDSEIGDDSFSIPDIQLEVSLSTLLLLDCQQEYLIVYSGPDQNSPQHGRYCGQSTEPNIVVERGLFMEYHTPQSNPNSTFNVTVKYGSGCGGRLKYPYRQIEFNEQYKNNVECIWEVETEQGFHLGLSFDGRFYIEDSKNCSKDYLLVQQRDDITKPDNWTTLAKICGRSPPKSINTTTSSMRLIFRSDEDVLADGFLAKFERNCGGIMYADDNTAILTSPGYPTGYESDLVCNWTILPREAHAPGVIVSFLHFDLEQAPISVCLFDNLTVITTNENDDIHQSIICGVKQKHEYRATKSIQLILRTDKSFTGSGFRLNYSTRLCGGIIERNTLIESPHQHTDNLFPANSNCYWNLTAPPGEKFIIKFVMLDFESHNSCQYDGVEIYVGNVPDDKQRRGRFCGKFEKDLPFLSIANERALIHSYSDDRDPSRGFRAYVTITRNCDERIRVSDSNSYTFTKYYNSSGYDPNLDCHIVFEAPAGYQLILQFRSFHIQGGDNCPNDFVELRDGSGPFADIIGKFCGNDLPPTTSSSQHTLFLRFVTDNVISDSGFELIARTERSRCGESLIKLESTGVTQAVINSPIKRDNSAGPSDVCYWKIMGDKPLHIVFENFELTESNANDTCSDDYLKLYNSEDANMIQDGYGTQLIFNGHKAGRDYMNFATEHIYCGQVKPDVYYANENEVFVKSRFNKPDTTSNFRLRAILNTDCSRHYDGLQGRIKISDTSDCEIYIRSPANYTLSLYFSDMGIYSYNCSESYIEIFDKFNQSLYRHCSVMNMNKNIFTTTNELRLHTISGTYLNTIDLTFLASPIETGPGCGGQFYNTQGIFANPFYPENVRNNSDCRWTIRVPSNNHVLLTFESFNLGSKSTCHTDYLQILEINKKTGLETEMRRYCGDDMPTTYKSNLSQLVVRFHKSVNYDGIGWVINFVGVYANYDIPIYTR